MDSITIVNTKNMSEEAQLVIDGLFVENGYTAKTDFVKDLD